MDFKLNSGIFIIHKVFELSAGLKGYAYPFFVMFAHKKKQQQQYQRSSDQA